MRRLGARQAAGTNTSTGTIGRRPDQRVVVEDAPDQAQAHGMTYFGPGIWS